MTNPLVSVVCITYNHEDYIKQCLDGFIMQQTNFPFVVIVADDCSTDKTREIIEEYAEQYPDIIIPVFRTENVGIEKNYIGAIKSCTTKYLAICDGDDYWINPNKLQKQVDFMKAHPDYAICFGKMKMVFENSNKPSRILPLKMNKNPQSYRKLLLGGYIPSNTVMYRYENLKNTVQNYPENIYPWDWFNHISAAAHGKIGFINELMSVYRRNEQGVSYTNAKDHEKELHKKYGIREMNFFYEVWQRVKDSYPEYYKEVFLPKLRDIYFTYLQMGDFAKLDILKEKYSDYFKDMESSTGIATKKHKKYKKMFTVSLIINIVLAVFLLGLSVLCFLKII